MYNYLNNKDILKPEHMSKKIIAKNIGADRLDAIEQSKIYAHINNKDTIVLLNELESRLRKFIPNSLMYYTDDDYIQLVLNRGQFMYGALSRLILGKPNSCHENTIDLFTRYKEDCRIATGWAFIQGDVWVEHSWLIHYLDKCKTKYEIIETTLKRTAYYGVILDYNESLDFVDFCYS